MHFTTIVLPFSQTTHIIYCIHIAFGRKEYLNNVLMAGLGGKVESSEIPLTTRHITKRWTNTEIVKNLSDTETVTSSTQR